MKDSVKEIARQRSRLRIIKTRFLELTENGVETHHLKSSTLRKIPKDQLKVKQSKLLNIDHENAIVF